MAIATLHPHPTLSNPETKKQGIEKALRGLDEDLDILYCLLGNATLSYTNNEPVDEETLQSIETTHRRLRRECDALCGLL